MKRIPIAGPWITDREVAYVADAARHAWQDGAGSFQRRFEAAFARHIGKRFAISLPSCTSALHLALAALDIGAGDEVIVPDITWIASSAPISYVGATPVFADIDRHNWCLCPVALERLITARTRAVIVVDLYGNMPEMRRILEVAEQHDIAIIEDAAEAIGAEQHARRAGGFGLFGAFSFHGSKTLTTGEGGMLVTDHEPLYQRCLRLRDHGRAIGDRWFCNEEVAFRYAMSDLQAALGLAQLERIEELTARKRTIFQWYAAALAGVEGVSLNADQPDTRNAYWMVTALVNPAYRLEKRRLMALLDEEGIDTRPFFHPLSSLPAYADLPQARVAAQRNSVAYRLSPYGINLPSGLQLTQDDVHRVCRALKTILTSAAQPAAR